MRVHNVPYQDQKLGYEVMEKAAVTTGGVKAHDESFSLIQFRTLANSMPQLVWIADAKGHLTYFNERRSSYFGSNLSKSGAGWEPIIHPEDLKTTIAAWFQAQTSIDNYEMEHRLRMADGNYLWHISRAFPMKAADGAILAWFGTATDIDRIKRSEAELQAAEERLRLATQAADMFAWEVDLKTGEMKWASNAADIIGCPAEMLSNQPESGNFFVAPRDRERLTHEFNKALSAGSSVFSLQFSGVPKDGETTHWRAFGKFLRSRDGSPVRAVGVTQNVSVQKRSDAALEVFADRLAAAEDGAGALVYDWDVKTGIVWRSCGMTRLLGWEQDEIAPTAEGWANIMHPDDKARLHEVPDETAFSPSGHLINEYRVRHKNGRYIWVLDSGRIFHDDKGKIVRIAGTTIDITVKRQSEESQRRTASLVDLSFEPIFVWHAERGIQEWNKGAEHLYGYTREEALGRRTHELLRTSHSQGLDQFLALLKRDKSWSGELMHRAKDGRTITVESRHQLIETGDDEFILETNRDIAERKQADAQMARLAAVAAASHDALFGANLEGVIEAWNPGAEALLGYTEAEALGMSHAKLALPDQKKEQQDIVAKVQAGQTVPPFDTQLLHKSGHFVNVSKAMTPVMSRDGTVIGISIAAHDISDRLEWEERQMLMNRELAHRVKNSFAVLQAILRSTLKSSPDPAQFAQAFSGRLQSLSAAHDVLSANDWKGAELGALLRHQLSVYLSGQRIILTGAPVNLTAEHAAPVSLIVNELATNALKYGALSVPYGVIAISWSVDDGDNNASMLNLEWREQGGPPASEPQHHGFGTTLIQRSLAEAQVHVEYLAEGLVCLVNWPLQPASVARRHT